MPERPIGPSRRRRIEWRLFLAAWLAYAFFHQGGGWNQNARFATARAVVEEGRLDLDRYLFYSAYEDSDAGPVFVRTPVVDGGFTHHGIDWVLAWKDASGELVPVTDARGRSPVHLDRVAPTAELVYARGHFYSSQAPGATMLAVPAYFVIDRLERLLGLNPDNWWILTVNAWLTTLLSVGLVSALGWVVFFRLALRLWDGQVVASVCATLALGFGTLVFPYATMLFEHNIVAVGLLGAFYLLLRAREETRSGRSRALLVLAGACAGYAAISAYVAVFPLLLLLAYLGHGRTPRDGWLWYVAGLLGPLLLGGVYNWISFGTPFTTSHSFPNAVFQGTSGLLQALELPRPGRVLALLFSPFRGLFFSSPFLLMGALGLVRMWRNREQKTMALLFGAVLLFFLLFNASLVGWHGGWSVGPRYLLPAVPLLALAGTFGFVRYFKTTAVLASLSIAAMVLFTAVDPQPSVGLSSMARRSDRAGWLREPLTEYALPIFVTGRAAPILRAKIDDHVRQYERELMASGTDAELLSARVEEFRAEREASLDRPDTPYTLARFVGPVSANPIGVHERGIAQLFQPAAPELRWNSFNAGELLFPASRWSLLVLAIVLIPLLAPVARLARAIDRRRNRDLSA